MCARCSEAPRRRGHRSAGCMRQPHSCVVHPLRPRRIQASTPRGGYTARSKRALEPCRPSCPSPGARRSGDTAPRAALAIVPPADLRGGGGGGAGQDGPGGTRSAAAPKPRRTRRPGDAARRATPAIKPPADLHGAGHDGPGGAGSVATNT
ncbi:hypothetical protein PVAP13_1KG106577 [Panicum virgatum]|uniref:Uncharacterized protein n=1 Tax=Panicum virgatum TaxID=38727 RepID=A0A8T0XFW2_PANVG|nr:hypothetical protein PVAP13_1KG106577 [Panicum virgatum]